MKVKNYEYYCDLDKERCVVFLGTEEAREKFKENPKLGIVDWDNKGEVRFE